MTNVEQFIKQLPTKLAELKTTFEAGLPVSGDDLTDIVTNTGIVSACVDQVNHHVEVDTNAINGVTMAVNSGNKDNGTQRIAIATNDVNLAAINTNAATTATLLNGWVGGYLPGVNVVLRGIHFGAGDENIAASSGNITNGTLRVAVADDDTNIAPMKAYMNTAQDKLNYIDININSMLTAINLIKTNTDDMKTYLNSINNILIDVHDSGTHTLKTST